MAFQVAVKPDYEHDDGIFVNSPCHAHLVVVDVDEDGLRIGGKNNNGSMVVEFEVVAANDPSQVGLHFRSYFTRTIDASWVILNFAIAAGIKDVTGNVVTSDYIKALKDKGTGPEIDFEKAGIGCQLFGDIAWNEYNNEKRLKIQGRSFYHMTSKQCTNHANWPRHAGFIAKAGIVMPKAGESGSGGHPATGSGAAAKPAASKTADSVLAGLTL